MRRSRIAIILLVTVSVAITAAAIWSQWPGVYVTVINSGHGPLSNVVVHVTGNEHPIGSVGVGEARTVRALPTGESHVELEFTDHAGRHHRLTVDCYFEREHYRGTITVEIENGAIKRKADHTELTLL